MPIYEYKCEGCGEVFEVRQKFSDDPIVVHEKCGGKVDKLLSAPAFQFKGSGWYVTDYGKGNSGPKKAESEHKSSSDNAAKSDGKSSETKTSESKPAETKTETKVSSDSSSSKSDS